ncbi:metallophosphoesterase family protein [Thermodesulfobacterium hveragerdense]|uniref:metallophosphoesterase family protein n=1 Tax=Thermodesulfobacterium hveragerdense TaxID=53424 RepID=UPI000406D523|nr:exonuclease SbcCD subunit D C-terminal domain-containing protein [Thermodesulfobacterium hveragerdense]
MKILHSSDWHLGKTVNNKKLIDYQVTFFEKTFLPLLKEQNPDLIVVSGDIVDKPIPDYETLKGYKEVLRMLASTKVPILFILGNHDSKRISLFKEFFKAEKIYLADDLSFFVNPFVWEKNGERVYFYLLPHLSVFELISLVKDLFPKEALDFLEEKDQVSVPELLSFLFSKIEIRRPAVLVGHLAVDSAVFSGEEVLRGRWQNTVGNEEIFPLSLFECFDLCLFGHLHRLQALNRPQTHNPKIFYSGSLMPYSFDEANHKKGFWFISLEKQKVSYEQIFIDPPYQLKTYEGYFKDLILKRDESFVRIILKDKTPVAYPYERLKKVFPNLLELKYEEEVKQEEKEWSLLGIDWHLDKTQRLDEKDLFLKFYRFVEGKEIEEPLFQVFSECLEEFFKNKQESVL